MYGADRSETCFSDLRSFQNNSCTRMLQTPLKKKNFYNGLLLNILRGLQTGNLPLAWNDKSIKLVDNVSRITIGCCGYLSWPLTASEISL